MLVQINTSIQKLQDMELIDDWLAPRIDSDQWSWTSKWKPNNADASKRMLKLYIEFNDDVSPTFITLFILRWGG
jgi:hypothetical protein